MSDITARYHDDEYAFTSPDSAATITMTRIRPDRSGDIKAELEVRWHQQPLAGLLYHGTLNLLAPRSVKTLSNELADRIGDFDWFGMLTAATYMAKKRYREGEPPVSLKDVDPHERPRWLLRPLLEYEGPTVVAAPGGSVKSMLALACGLSVATGRTKVLGIRPMAQGPVLYLDWESDQYSHRNRLEAMCQALDMPVPENIWYRQEWAPLAESVDELRRHIAQLEPAMVVIDSKGMALSGDPKEADATIRTMKAAKRLGPPTMVVDHVTKEAIKKGADSPFGSVYTSNVARNVWIADVAERVEGEVTVLWKHVKSNNGPANTKLAWRVEFDMADDDYYSLIRVKPLSPVEVVAMERPPDNSLRGRIEMELLKSPSPMTVSELAIVLGESPASVRARLNEGRADNQFANIATKPGMEGKWTTIEQVTGRSLPDPF